MAVALLVFFCLGLWMFLRRKQSSSSIPGPWGLPLIGHLPFVNSRAPHLTFTQWAKKYGAIFKVNMGGQELMIVNGYKHIKELLVRPDFNSRPDMFRINTFRCMGGFAFSEPNSCWKSLRKATHRGIKCYGPGLDRINETLNRITELSMENMNGRDAFDPWDTVYKFMLHSMTVFTIGEHFEPSSKLCDVVEELDQKATQALNPVSSAAALDSAPWLRHFGFPAWKNLQHVLQARNEMWEMVKPMLQSDSASIAWSFLEAQEQNPAIDTQRVKCAIGDMMIAGTVTTTTSMYCLLQLLGHHPNVQKKLQNEIDSVIKSEQALIHDLPDMPYMRATLLELQRYSTISPLGLPHAATYDSHLAGCNIPKGTNFLPNVYGVHHDPDLWNNPHKFDPERFLCDDGSLVPADHPNRRHILAFGLGPRLCVGEHFAHSRIFLFIAALLQQFTLKIAEESAHISSDPRSFGLNMAVEPNHYKIKLCSRSKVPAEKIRNVGQA